MNIQQMGDRTFKIDRLQGATLIGIVAGFYFYEHPTLGDEAPLIVADKTAARVSHWFELPDAMEIADWTAELA